MSAPAGVAMGIELDYEQQQRIPMSFEAWLEFDPGHNGRTEWVDGITIVTPPASFPHNAVVANVVFALKSALDGVVVAVGPGTRTGATRVREPDVAVYDHLEDVVVVEQVPIVLVEVLSPSTRREDLVRKREEYLSAGAGQYWIIDPTQRWLVAYLNAGGRWEIALELDDDQPEGEIAVAGYGTVNLTVAELFG